MQSVLKMFQYESSTLQTLNPNPFGHVYNSIPIAVVENDFAEFSVFTFSTPKHTI